MRKIISVMFLTLLSTVALAATTPAIKQVNVAVRLQNSTSGQTLQADTTLGVNIHRWTVIADNNSQQNPLIILAKVRHADSKTVGIKFVFVDLSNMQTLAPEAMMMVKYGQKGEMTTKDAKGEYHLSVKATM